MATAIATVAPTIGLLPMPRKPIISMCLKGDCRIKIRATGDEILLHEGFSCLIPASIADYDITPLYGQSKVLDAYINNMDEDLLHKVSRFLHISTR